MPITRPVLADVARLAGVSAMTVSNVMNGRTGVAEATRERVLVAADQVGYVPNLAARGLVRGRTNLVGVISHDLTVQYAWEIVRGISDALADEGLEVLISATYQDATRELERVRLLSTGLVDGLILIGPVLEEETLQALLASRVPCVVIDPRSLATPLSCIVVDNYDGARTATAHLVNLGHERIGLIAGDPAHDSAAERRRGYVDALAAAGIEPDESLEAVGYFTQAGGFAAALHLLGLEHPPTAMFATADLSAMGAIDAARSRGLAVPGDLSVVGFDDIPQAAQSFPPLTTVRQPLEECGRAAVAILQAQIAGDAVAGTRMELATALVVRDTAGTPAHPLGGSRA